MTSTHVCLSLSRLESDPRELSGCCCPKCFSELDLNQPETQFPSRLLATCEVCHSWFVVDLEMGLVIHIPTEECLREAGAVKS